MSVPRHPWFSIDMCCQETKQTLFTRLQPRVLRRLAPVSMCNFIMWPSSCCMYCCVRHAQRSDQINPLSNRCCIGSLVRGSKLTWCTLVEDGPMITTTNRPAVSCALLNEGWIAPSLSSHSSRIRSTRPSDSRLPSDLLRDLEGGLLCPRALLTTTRHRARVIPTVAAVAWCIPPARCIAGAAAGQKQRDGGARPAETTKQPHFSNPLHSRGSRSAGWSCPGGIQRDFRQVTMQARCGVWCSLWSLFALDMCVCAAAHLFLRGPDTSHYLTLFASPPEVTFSRFQILIGWRLAYTRLRGVAWWRRARISFERPRIPEGRKQPMLSME